MHFRILFFVVAESLNEEFKQHKKQSNNERNTRTAVMFLTIDFLLKVKNS